LIKGAEQILGGNQLVTERTSDVKKRKGERMSSRFGNNCSHGHKNRKVELSLGSEN